MMPMNGASGIRSPSPSNAYSRPLATAVRISVRPSLAMLYGEGEFVKTTAIAVGAGYDCDNQASTCAGLMGVIHGAGGIPDRFTKSIAPNINWQEPFNDHYVNYTRDGLPISSRISDIVDRIVDIAEQAIMGNGAKIKMADGTIRYVIKCDF